MAESPGRSTAGFYSPGSFDERYGSYDQTVISRWCTLAQVVAYFLQKSFVICSGRKLGIDERGATGECCCLVSWVGLGCRFGLAADAKTLRGDVTDVVPQSDHWFGLVVLVAELAEARGAQGEVFSGVGGEA